MKTIFENHVTIATLHQEGHFWVVTTDKQEIVFRDYESAREVFNKLKN